MITIYFKHILRTLRNNKSSSILNIAGLAIGLTCFSLIALWVTDETSYDKFNKNYSRIARLTGIEKRETGITETAVSSAPMATALKNDYPEIEDVVRMDLREEIIKQNNQQILQSEILVADPSFFNIFSYNLSRGSAATALSKPFSLILTESSAKKYFGDADPMGKTLKLFMNDSTGSGALYTITGIIPDPKERSHIPFSMIASFSTIELVHPDVLTVDGWGDASYYTYVLLKPGVDTKSFSKKIGLFYGKYIGERFDVWKNIYSYRLEALSEIYLHSGVQDELAATGNISQVYLFSSIGLLILLLAGINYVNLATAGSAKRAKEISVKKVSGAKRIQLIQQFLIESVVIAMLALIIAVCFASLLQPLFFELTGKKISLLASPILLLILTGITILLGILSGIYPAIIITRFKPALVLKGAFQSGNSGSFLRKTLVVSQFAITIVLIIGIIVIYAQMNYVRHKDLGYNKDALLFLRVHGNADVVRGYEAFKNELISSGLIKELATSNTAIVGGLATGGASTVDKDGNPIQVSTSRIRTDADFLNTYEIPLLAGGNFRKQTAPTDSFRPVILNETAIKQFGWKNADDAIGRPFSIGGTKGEVIGVVKDFHFNSLETGINALAIFPIENYFSRISARVDMNRPSASVEIISKTWKKHFPSALLDFSFVDEQVEAQYRKEKQFSKVFFCFSVMSLLIACFGLYGLTAFAAAQKTKEIGVRKVLGATASGIVMLLSGSFLRLVLLAFIIAVPIAAWLMQEWIAHFAYRTEISWWMFVIAGIAVALIAFITVSFQSLKAALVNPVRSLRTE